MNKLRVGVVGVGYLGKFHAEKYAGMKDVDLVGIADLDHQQALQIAEQLGTQSYTDYRHLFGKVDAVSIAVPTAFHFNISRDFLERDVDVLIEKPMTINLKEADELIRIAESKRKIIQVGHLERFNPAIAAAEKYLNHPGFIEAHRLCTYKERGTDVSVVLDLMIHDIDIVLNIVGSPLTTIHAAGVQIISEHLDIANARLEFENGCVANITASRVSMINERKVIFYQKDGCISVDFANREITLTRPDTNKEKGSIPGMDVHRMNFPQADALKAELESFVTSIRRRQLPEVTGKMGRDALHVALTIMDQIQKKDAT